MSPRPLLPLFLSAAYVCLALPGCESSSHERAAHRMHAERSIAMQGEARFFDGTLRAEATVSRIFPGRDEESEEGGGHRGGGGGRRGHRHGGGYGGGESASQETGDEDGGHTIHLPHMSAPPLTLRLKLENTSPQPIDVEIRDVNSDLGSFAVRPERLQLAPGQTGEVDPMVSQLGIISAQIPVTVVLRAGGKTESQVLQVKDTTGTMTPQP